MAGETMREIGIRGLGFCLPIDPVRFFGYSSFPVSGLGLFNPIPTRVFLFPRSACCYDVVPLFFFSFPTNIGVSPHNKYTLLYLFKYAFYVFSIFYFLTHIMNTLFYCIQYQNNNIYMYKNK